jgi:hypothetical protein
MRRRTRVFRAQCRIEARRIRVRRTRRGHTAHGLGCIRLRTMFRDEQLDFLLRFEASQLQQPRVLRRQYRREQPHGRQMQLAATEHFKRKGELACEASSMQPESRFGIGHMKHANRVLEHRCVAEVSMQPSRFDFTQMREQFSTHAPVFTDAVTQAQTNSSSVSRLTSSSSSMTSPNAQNIYNTGCFRPPRLRCTPRTRTACFARSKKPRTQQGRPARSINHDCC